MQDASSCQEIIDSASSSYLSTSFHGCADILTLRARQTPSRTAKQYRPQEHPSVDMDVISLLALICQFLELLIVCLGLFNIHFHIRKTPQNPTDQQMDA